MPFSADVVSHVMAKYSFSTHGVVFADGAAYRTKAWSPAGSRWNTGQLRVSGGKYAVASCDAKVLMKCPRTLVAAHSWFTAKKN